jgi:hypothetical protein
MSDTTSILDLPTDPTGGGSIGGNISLSANEQSSNSQLTLDQNTINQIVSGIQQASTSGLTQLSSRDIPRSTENIIHDEQIKPNYIPEPTNIDYIKDETETNEIIQEYNNKRKNENTLDDLYDEIQIPLLMSVLYFLFQLPIFKKYLYQFFPVLFSRDGNTNLYGYIFTSILFGLLYYMLYKFIIHFSKF